MLDRKQFVALESAEAVDDLVYRFRNLMIKDATYGSLLKRARAQFHERFVDWAERVNRERGREQEFEEILGYHLEQAYRYRRELGQIDEAARDIAARATAKLGAAGRRAFARGDLPAAASLLRRAAALLEPEDVHRVELLIDLAEVQVEAGEFGEATEILDEVSRTATELQDDRLAARSVVTSTAIRLLSEELKPGELDTMRTSLEAGIAAIQAASDVASAAGAWRVLAAVESLAGRDDVAVQALQRVIDLAGSAGDRRLANRAAAGLANTMFAGDATASEVSAYCSSLLERVSGDRKAEAIILSTSAVAEAMQGHFDEARELYRRSAANVADLGRSTFSASQSLELSMVEMLAGQPERAVELLRADDAQLGQMGERYFRSSITGRLAHALEAMDDLDEAARFADLARDLSDEDDTESQVIWRTALAKVSARSGEADAARTLVDDAIALAETTNELDLKANAAADAALVYSQLGADEAAANQLDAARRLFTQKGNVAAIQALDRRMSSIASLP